METEKVKHFKIDQEYVLVMPYHPEKMFISIEGHSAKIFLVII